ALLSNHFHLLLRCNNIELSRFMRRLLTGYAIDFNRRHRRSGHLFQNRYKSIVCEEDSYLLELVRYIHLNPFRAKMVSDMETLEIYPWCGHGVLLGKESLTGQSVDELLFLFGKEEAIARNNYRQFVADGVIQGNRPELVGGGLRRSQQASGTQDEIELFDERVLGSGSFVESLQQNETLKGILPGKMTLSEIQQVVGTLFNVDPEAILIRTRLNSVSEARVVFCYIAVRMTGEKGTDVGRFLGISPSGVSRAVIRGEHLILAHKPLKVKMQNLKEEIGALTGRRLKNKKRGRPVGWRKEIF
nr:transposase [Desulfobulbaceae bacterium]